MSKQDFLNELRAALGSRVNSQVVADNVRYYENYINAEVNKGRSEEEVLKSLGDPRLLARSIADAEKRAGTTSSAYEEEEYIYENGNRQNKSGPQVKVHHIPIWLMVCLVILIVFLVISVAFSLLSFFFPVVIPVLLIVFICRLLRR